MLGYIKAYKPDMTFREFETYKSVYCSLCKTLGREYGVLSRMILSYDFTFLNIIHSAGNDMQAEYKTRKCVCNPLKKCTYCTSGEEERNFAAAVTVMLGEYKIKDNIDDEGFFKSLFYRIIHPYFKRQRKKAAARYPELSAVIEEYKSSQAAAEKNPAGRVDAAAEPTAAAVGKIFELCGTGEPSARILYRFGYCLGKWIYLLDAGEDLNEDIKMHRFNPLIGKLKSGGYGADAERGETLNFIAEYITPNLQICEVECQKAFELADIKKYRSIIQNILYLGLQNTRKNVLCGKKRGRKVTRAAAE